MQLREARRQFGLTQTQLAKLARVDQRTISRLEAGRVKEPAYRVVIRICRVLGVDPQQIDEFRLDDEGEL